ncbi:hypothetical protein ABEF95_001625 [Exophiala dermatitidis]
MPPPMPNPTKRMTANPARPARYRPGKPVPGQESSDEEDEEEYEKEQEPPKQPQRRPPTRPQPQQARAAVREESEDEDEEGFVTEPEDEDEARSQSQAVKPSSGQTGLAPVKQEQRQPKSVEEEDESEEDESEEEQEGSSDEEEESSSEEEEIPRRKFQRPTFIKKDARKQSVTGTPGPETNGGAAATAEAGSEADTQARRLAQAEQYIKDKLERDALARAQGKKAWDDDDDVLPESMVDDTDGIDPEAEYAAWKVRELKRLKRDREALIAREKELEEIERRRNLTAEEREKEDREFLEKQREERESGRSNAQFLARYHHKGAFFQGDEAAEMLRRRDIMGAQFEDQVTDKSTLPEYMRLRDMTKLGKKGRTRYTDLKGQDTGQFGEDVKRWKGSIGGAGRGTGGGFGNDLKGVDEKFLPDDHRGGGMAPTGANATAVASRKDDRDRERDRDSYRQRDRDRYRDNDRRDRESNRQKESSYDDRDTSRYSRKRSYSASRSRSRSRSRSPRRRRRDPDEEREWNRDRPRDRERESAHAR